MKIIPSIFVFDCFVLIPNWYHVLLKFIQAVIFSINTYKQYMISVGNENKTIKNKDRWNYFHHMPILPLLGDNHCLPLWHMAKRFIWLEETKNILMSLRLDIWLIRVCMLINPSETKKKNVWIQNLVNSHNILLKPHYQRKVQVW